MVMAKMGRPKIEIDYVLLERLCTIQCTDAEIAACLKISEQTLDNRKRDDPTFLSIYKTAKDGGKMSLRREMYAKAKGGNVTMMIWLSKQYLGMADKTDSNVNMRINSWDDLEREVGAEKQQGQADDGA